MNAATDRPSRFPWPPVLYICATALAILLAWLAPLPWFGQPLSDILFAIGLIVAVGALALIVQGARTLVRAKTTVHPTHASDHLVTDGVYALSRNPIYVGNTGVMIGLGLAFGIVWFLGLGLVAAFATQKLQIEPEERHLEARFGKKFRDYQKKVRRWL